MEHRGTVLGEIPPHPNPTSSTFLAKANPTRLRLILSGSYGKRRIEVGPWRRKGVSSPLEAGRRGGVEEPLAWVSSGSSMEPAATNPPTSVGLVLHRDSCSLAVPKPRGIQLDYIVKSRPESRQLRSLGTRTMPLAVGPAPACRGENPAKCWNWAMPGQSAPRLPLQGV